MILLKNLVEVSEKVGVASRKKEKILLLARLQQQGRGDEISLAALYLSGQLPQGRLGIGSATLQEILRVLLWPIFP
jgi:DNA ligase-1